MRSRPRPSPQGDTRTALLGDGARLRDILALAGPEIAPRLLAQIAEDLDATAALLAPAIGRSDWDVVRAQSHVLISVAGTIGAMGVHAAACRLNELAHAQDKIRTKAVGAAVLADLATLITEVSVQRTAP